MIESTLFSTTGSLDSEFVNKISDSFDLVGLTEDVLRQKFYDGHLKYDHTYVFEIIHKSDPHIIVEKEGVYLLAGRENEWESPYIEQSELDAIAGLVGFSRPKWYEIYYKTLVESMNGIKSEGFVVYDLHSDLVLKLKSDYYTVLKKIARMQKDKLVHLWSQTDRFMSSKFSESGKYKDFYLWLIDNYNEGIFIELCEQERLMEMRKYKKIVDI